MHPSNDADYLRTQQYKDASNLNARANLHQLYSTNPYGWSRWVFDHIVNANLPPNARIVEFGCGPGGLWLQSLDRVPPGWSITLTDFSPGMIEESERNLANSGRNFTFQIADIQSPPFESGTFDAAIANHMLYHVPNRAKALSEVRRVLKPNGHFFAATNGLNHMRELNDLLRRFDPQFDLNEVFKTESFRLENGLDQLAAYFSDVNLSLYEDDLNITAAEPFVAYILSSSLKNRLSESQIQRLRQFIADIIQENGAIHIQKAAGLFTAH